MNRRVIAVRRLYNGRIVSFLQNILKEIVYIKLRFYQFKQFRNVEYKYFTKRTPVMKYKATELSVTFYVIENHHTRIGQNIYISQTSVLRILQMVINMIIKCSFTINLSTMILRSAFNFVHGW